MTAPQAAWKINTIYIIKNKCNEKVYIGQTWQTLEMRWRTGYENCTHMQNAINKYGKDNFYSEVLTFCGIQETADYWEDYFIKYYDSIKNGYNMENIC